jgi:hypothetical protein
MLKGNSIYSVPAACYRNSVIAVTTLLYYAVGATVVNTKLRQLSPAFGRELPFEPSSESSVLSVGGFEVMSLRACVRRWLG